MRRGTNKVHPNSVTPPSSVTVTFSKSASAILKLTPLNVATITGFSEPKLKVFTFAPDFV
jgi:hypothetical protein